MPDKSSLKPKGKSALSFWEKLKIVFPSVQCERRMPWLVIPVADEAAGTIEKVRSALVDHCRASQPVQKHQEKQKCTPELLSEKLGRPARPKLEFDFFIPELKLAFEFDERQHFTAERAISLECYEGEVETAFDIGEWLRKCRAIRAVDPDPIWRDWQRAYRDAVRDIQAENNGVRLMRYSYDEQPDIEQLSDVARNHVVSWLSKLDRTP